MYFRPPGQNEFMWVSISFHKPTELLMLLQLHNYNMIIFHIFQVIIEEETLTILRW